MKSYIYSIVVFVVMMLIFINHKHAIYKEPVQVSRGLNTWEEYVLKYEKIRERAEQEKQNQTMDTSLIMLIVSTTGILAASLINNKTLEKNLMRKLVESDAINIKQHVEINQEIKFLKTPEKLEASIRQLTAGKLEACRPELRKFINEESERLIEVMGQIMRGGFNYASLAQSIVKIDAAESESYARAGQFGYQFGKKYLGHLKCVTTKLKDDVSDISLDEVYNDKHARLHLACQVFLRDHLNGIIRIYDELV